jgi:hypothetical protein
MRCVNRLLLPLQGVHRVENAVFTSWWTNVDVGQEEKEQAKKAGDLVMKSLMAKSNSKKGISEFNLTKQLGIRKLRAKRSW